VLAHWIAAGVPPVEARAWSATRFAAH
jgi:hypothetical protein